MSSSTQASQRTRKAQSTLNMQGSSQTIPSREMSPSPSFRERQRTIKAQSLPVVPSVMQVYGSANPSSAQRQGQQPSPTTSNASHQAKRLSPPPSVSQGLQGNIKLPSPPHQSNNVRDDLVQERLTPPPLLHAHSQSNVHQLLPLAPPPPPAHSHSQPILHAHIAANPQMGYPRPINRVPPPQFLNPFHAMEENWHMTEELMAEIERADLAQSLGQFSSVPGMSGVAYAGGAASGAVYIRETSSPKDAAIDRVRITERGSPKDVDSGSNRRQVWDRERQQTGQAGSPQFSSQEQQLQNHNQERVSPPYQSGEPPGNHIPLRRDTYQPAIASQPRVTTPPSVRKPNVNTSDPVRTTPPATIKLSNAQTPPLQAMKTRTPDRSLPVQEEPEDGEHDLDQTGPPEPSNDLSRNGHVPRYDHGGRDSRVGHREEDDDDTLIENESENHPGRHRGSQDEEEGFTPRSPTANLPDDYQARQYGPPIVNGRSTLVPKHRNGATDQLGLRSFDASVFEIIPSKMREESQGGVPVTSIDPDTSEHLQPDYTVRNQQYTDDRVYREGDGHPRYHPPQLPPQDDINFVEDPAVAYIQAYLQSPRPNAPIPPTPHSQTAAPSPLPLISGNYRSPAPPIGSPYPYPFSHVRRSQPYSTYPVNPAPSSNYDPNHPSVIQEQLALQMQMYALNNHAVAMSDSTFSPSSTPFPGAGYNPWAFLQASRAFGGRRGDPTMSLQSSPSHEPVSLPFPSSKGRGLKRRERSTNLRHQGSLRQKVHPPPRVDSTQPRETSPEPYSSGEETAGEERYEIPDEGNWVNGNSADDSGEWVDEDDEDDGDLLDLEYHPDFVINPDRRKRKWGSHWEALKKAFQALDRETDATLILLAAPSHSGKFYSATSRSVRREMSRGHSPAMINIRSSFRNIALRRRASRAQGLTLVERLLSSTSTGNDSEAGSESREGDLKRALETALGSLGALRSIYEQRAVRWEDEMLRISDERERVELLLRQTVGIGLTNGNDIGRAL